MQPVLLFQFTGDLLSIYNVQAEEVKGEVNGKPYNGIVYSATNDKGEKQGNPFKSSSLGKSVGYEAIQRHIKKSAKDIQDKNLKERTRSGRYGFHGR